MKGYLLRRRFVYEGLVEYGAFFTVKINGIKIEYQQHKSTNTLRQRMHYIKQDVQ